MRSVRVTEDLRERRAKHDDAVTRHLVERGATIRRRTLAELVKHGKFIVPEVVFFLGQAQVGQSDLRTGNPAARYINIAGDSHQY